MSGTYHTACGAREMAENKDDIVVYNTKTLCGPHRYMVQKARALAKQGRCAGRNCGSIGECVQHCESFLIARLCFCAEAAD